MVRPPVPSWPLPGRSGFRVRRVAELDRLDDVFQREIDEADLAVHRLAQLCVVGIRESPGRGSSGPARS